MSQLAQIMETILHRHAEIEKIKDAMKDDYADAQSEGFDKTALGAAIREIRSREKALTPKAQERAAIVEMYVCEYDASHVRVGAREGQPSGAGTGSTVRASAPIREDA